MTLDIPENQTIDAGYYPAVLTKLEVKTIEKGAYAGDTIRIWTFQVDGEDEPITGSSSLAFGPNSKAYGWFVALMGRPPVFGEKGVQIVGRPCLLNIIVDEKSGYNKVADVLPPKAGQKAVAPASTPLGSHGDDLPDLPFSDGTPLEEPPTYGREDLPA